MCSNLLSTKDGVSIQNFEMNKSNINSNIEGKLLMTIIRQGILFDLQEI